MDQLVTTLTRADNLPILAMVPTTIVLIWLWLRVARRNDRLVDDGGVDAVRAAMEGPRPERGDDDDPDLGRVHTWPYLVRVELLATLIVILVLTIWSIGIDAPLEQMADPTRTPNPSKAPWYFLGLQEMLVYFDPWIAGVLLPLLIIGGLCAIPYVDVNPEGSGYYSWKRRRFAISVFLFGFLVLWLLLILIGVTCRGPGWNWFWPWQTWDRERVVSTATRNWSDVFGIAPGPGALLFGAATVLGYYGLGALYWFRRRGRSPTLQRMGPARYTIAAFLLLTMLALPIKIALRLALDVKYVWVTPWFHV
ncbi:MAG TPA: hypothetical protein VL172_20880 [Kofleriaceae bacterium]|nr:hypothetical protein [Kofleriaceae bacterium]